MSTYPNFQEILWELWMLKDMGENQNVLKMLPGFASWEQELLFKRHHLQVHKERGVDLSAHIHLV